MARLGLSNTHDFSDGGVLSSRVEYIHRGKMQSRVFNNPEFDTVPSYDVVNLYFSYVMANRPVSFNLIVSNLFDENGINNVFNNPFGIWSTSNEYIPPLEVIGSVRFAWE